MTTMHEFHTATNNPNIQGKGLHVVVPLRTTRSVRKAVRLNVPLNRLLP